MTCWCTHDKADHNDAGECLKVVDWTEDLGRVWCICLDYALPETVTDAKP